LKLSLEDRQKYQLIFDSTSECEVFFRYKAHMIELNKLSLSINLARITKDEAIETLRRALVYSMRIGDRLVLHCGKYNIDFMSQFNDPVNFPIEKIFNFEEWRKEENYKSIVRPSEDVDLLGNKKCYFMNENFDIVIVRDVSGETEADDKRDDFKAKVPLLDSNFDIYFVSRDLHNKDETKPNPYVPLQGI
jgi:hypothetical protein